jgi:dienelactone hydrolase
MPTGVLQELFGVNADIRKHCDELAEQGYLALAPDLFWRQEPGVDLNVTSEADWQRGLRLYSAYDRDAGVRDIKGTIDAARSFPECNGKVALLGYCLGALMVFMTAVRNDGIDAAVWYHGADTEKYLGEVDGLQRRGYGLGSARLIREDSLTACSMLLHPTPYSRGTLRFVTEKTRLELGRFFEHVKEGPRAIDSVIHLE